MPVRDDQVSCPNSSRIQNVSNESAWKHLCTKLMMTTWSFLQIGRKIMLQMVSVETMELSAKNCFYKVTFRLPLRLVCFANKHTHSITSHPPLSCKARGPLNPLRTQILDRDCVAMLQTRFILFIESSLIRSYRITKFWCMMITVSSRFKAVPARGSGSPCELANFMTRIFQNMCKNIASARWLARVWSSGPFRENGKNG